MSRTKAISLVWVPTADEKKKLQGPGEVSGLKLVTGGASAVVSIYDAADASGINPNALRWVMDSSTTFADSQCFTEPLTFEKGVFAYCEQGGGQGAQLCLAASKYVV